LYGPPDGLVVDGVAAVNRRMVKGNDRPVGGDLRGDEGGMAPHTIDGLPDDLDGALDQLARAAVPRELVEGHAGRVVDDVLRRVADVFQDAYRIRRHTATAGSD
jgi:hypothetical protein